MCKKQSRKDIGFSRKDELKIIMIFPVIILLFVSGIFSQVSAQSDKQIEEIRRIYKETNEKITRSENDGESSEIYLSELVVNKNNGSYPAVGIYNSVVKFYYTFGNREQNPYPDRLIKVEITTNRSARTENAEFLFNPAGQLIFYFENKDDAEIRVYFSAEKPIRILKGTQNVNLNDKTATEQIKNILSEKRKLTGIFSNSLDFKSLNPQILDIKLHKLKHTLSRRSETDGLTFNFFYIQNKSFQAFLIRPHFLLQLVLLHSFK